MGKRALFIAFVCFVLVVFGLIASPNIAIAQEKTFDEAFIEYSLKKEEYLKAHDEYRAARANYLRFQTLTARDEAIAATKKMLIARDEVIIYYVDMLSARTREAEGISGSAKDETFLLLEVERNWYSEHKDRVPSAATLEDLEQDSKEARNRYEQSPGAFYMVHARVAQGKVNEYNTRFDSSMAALESKIAAIRTDTRPEYILSDTKLVTIDRFMLDAKNRGVRADEKAIEVELAIEKLPIAKKNSLNSFNQSIFLLESLKQYLREGLTLSREVIREIKYQ